jgi:hypothetical protein
MGKPVGNVYLSDGRVLEDVMIVKVIRKKDLTLKLRILSIKTAST